jgi:hypothetical protein
MSLYLWVGWPLQHQIIDGPVHQGVLIWDDVCQVGMWVMCLQPPIEVGHLCLLTPMSAMLKDVD